MKKIVVISFIGVAVLIGSIIGIYNIQYDNDVYKNTKINQANTNAITMMYETESGSGEYQVSGDGAWPQEGYTFNEELSKCENGSKLTWNEESKQVLLEANKTDKCYVYFDKETDIVYLAEYIKGLYTSDGENGLYYHDGTGNYTNADQEAGDNSYRYAGANPNNYVCFGTDASTCPIDNLYRIIGVFDGQVKLIKNISIGDYALDADNIDFSGILNLKTEKEKYLTTKLNGIIAAPPVGSSGSNDWSTADLNYYLNNDFLLMLNANWQNLISDYVWKVGGNTWSKIRDAVVKTAYQNEIVNPAESTTYNAKIGLMYVSDYGYAASPDNWNTRLYDYNNDTNKNNNWMFMGLHEWTISPESSDSERTFNVDSFGYVSSSHVVGDSSVRPAFYLQAWALYSNGDGSIENPYRISAPTNLIQFSVNGIAHFAEEGMTWRTWVDSVYNNQFSIKDGDKICVDTKCIFESLDSLIIDGEDYKSDHTGGTA